MRVLSLAAPPVLLHSAPLFAPPPPLFASPPCPISRIAPSVVAAIGPSFELWSP